MSLSNELVNNDFLDLLLYVVVATLMVGVITTYGLLGLLISGYQPKESFLYPCWFTFF